MFIIMTSLEYNWVLLVAWWPARQSGILPLKSVPVFDRVHRYPGCFKNPGVPETSSFICPLPRAVIEIREKLKARANSI